MVRGRGEEDPTIRKEIVPGGTQLTSKGHTEITSTTDGQEGMLLLTQRRCINGLWNDKMV